MRTTETTLPRGGRRSRTAVPSDAKRGRAPRPATQAEGADRHWLYEESVQCPETDVALYADLYRRIRGREAKALREDFCGTAKLAVTWALAATDRRAYGIDLDAPTLEWGRQHNVVPHRRKLGSRVKLVQANVLDRQRFKADIICANNFSYCVFKERAQLEVYLARAYEGLKRHGLLFLELYGGTEAISVMTEDRECEGFTYVWDQHSFNPLTAETVCHIHFEFADGSRIDRAFTYDWRLWTLPELRELLQAVGFSEVRCYWEALEDDPDDKDMLRGSGEYVEVDEPEQQESWLAYLVALR